MNRRNFFALLAAAAASLCGARKPEVLRPGRIVAKETPDGVYCPGIIGGTIGPREVPVPFGTHVLWCQELRDSDGKLLDLIVMRCERKKG